MLSKFFCKPSPIRLQLQQDSSLTEALVRRVNAIDFQPSRGFLKDQWQQKRSVTLQLEPLSPPRSGNFARHVSTQNPG